jgi:DNA gyrase subunit A
VRPSGLIAINLDEDDNLGWVLLAQGEPDVIIVTEKGQALRFNSGAVRSMGRTAAGVNAIRLDRSDRVASACLVDAESDLLILTTKGYGKRTAVSEFRAQGRYTKGIRCTSSQMKTTGVIAAARTARPEDEIIVISNDGMVLRTRVADIPQMGRTARGAKVFNLRPGDATTSVAIVQNGG